MAEHLFLTGSTGFIGSRLLTLWLERTEAQVTLLIRNRAGITAESQLQRLLTTYPEEARNDLAKRVRFVHGDLAVPHLGLGPDDFEGIADTVTHIVHAGAELRFDLSLAQARRTNTDGTATVLDLARRCSHLERFDYMGTAYVAGRGSGIVREDARHDGIEHNNTYERSKYEAELLVREAMAELPATILRPSIVTCDLKTGYAPSTSAFYRLLRAVASGALEVLPGRADIMLDLVSVDYIVEAAFVIGRRSDLVGHGYHLSAGVDNRISLGELRDLACASFGRESLDILLPEKFTLWSAAVCSAAPEKCGFLDELALYVPYLSNNPIFDNANTRRALTATDVRPVSVMDYFDRVAAYVLDTLPETDTHGGKSHRTPSTGFGKRKFLS